MECLKSFGMSFQVTTSTFSIKHLVFVFQDGEVVSNHILELFFFADGNMLAL